MDKYLTDVRSHIFLALSTLKARQAFLDVQPKGMSMRYNKQAHTAALKAMLVETYTLSEVSEDGWWEHDDEVPF